MTRSLIMFVSCLLIASMPVRAEIDYPAINIALAKQIFVPAFTELDRVTKAQSDLWGEACRPSLTVTIDDLRNAFHNVSDRWADVFHWNIGPITLYLRRDRFYHWPERRNSIGKGLNKLLADKNAKKLEVAYFEKISVALQGMPALERLLFENTNVLDDQWACRVGQAIADNLARISADTIAEWHEEVVDRLQSGREHDEYFSEPSDFLNRVFNELATGYAIITDQKIRTVLGTTAQKAKPRLLENRRSQRFLRNLRRNVDALFNAQRLINTYIPAHEAREMDKAFLKTEKLLKTLKPFEPSLTDDIERAKIRTFIASLKNVRDLMARSYVNDLELVVGFNSLDGD